jgi:exopolyphosphatase/guanosine-5'-triphosphate,3'-diphosphate pyrophosphatase
MTIASIDIGTNTVLMVIARYEDTGNLVTLRNEFTIPRIGKGLAPGDPISGDKTKLLMDILSGFKQTAKEYNCEKIIATATNAFRIASNSKELQAEIKKMGIEIEVASGEEESCYAYLGAVSGSGTDEKTLVIDIGGGSTEVIFGQGDSILYRKSFHTGVVSLTEKNFKNDPPVITEIAEVNTELQQVFEELNENNFHPGRSIAIAGTPTTLACISRGLKDFDEEAIEGSSLAKEEIRKMISEISSLSSKDILNKYKAVVKGREDVLLAGTLILFHLMNILKLNEVTVSTKGIRYGAIINYFNQN